MPFVKGQKEKIGRPKGLQNKTTTSIKNAFIEAFQKRGGVKALLAWADEEPGEFYKILGKMCPKELEVSGPGGGPIQTVVEVAFIGNDSKDSS